VRAAELLGRSIKPIGSLCTWSPAACPDPDGIALLTDGLDRTSDPEWPLLREEAPMPPTAEARSNAEVRDARHLIRVEAGSALWALNEALAARGLGLKTLGGYGGERVGGALSTGTHGSSVFSGPICDFVRSVDVVWRGVMVRLEPSDGPTDPAAFAASPAHQGWAPVAERRGVSHRADQLRHLRRGVLVSHQNRADLLPRGAPRAGALVGGA
jgi:FAD/FMN-containing dehydrogenase